jgi:hypothetical protein
VLEINWNPSRRDLRQFGAIWLPAFAVLFGVIVGYRSGAWNTATALWILALVSAALGLAKPEWLKPLFVGWMIAAYPIGWTVSHLVLGAAYYGLFTLVAIIMRVFRYDPLNRTRSRSSETYWADHEQRTEPGAYFRQF